MTQELLTLIRQRIATPNLIHDMAEGMSNPPQMKAKATSKQIAATETELGFALPPLYRQILIEIGNGGFGPGYGLLGAQGGHVDFDRRTLIEIYRQTHDPNTRREDAPLLPGDVIYVPPVGALVAA